MSASDFDRWSETKSSLKEKIKNLPEDTGGISNEQVISWLSTFDETFDLNSVKAIRAAGQKILDAQKADPRNYFWITPYPPYTFEQLLRSASSLIDRCLIYRRQMSELEIAAVQAGSEYLLRQTLKPLADKIDDTLNFSERAVNISNSQRAAALEFGNDQNNSLTKGLGIQALGAAEGGVTTSELEKQRRTYLQQRSDLSQQARDSLFSRHLSQGNSHNFAERYEQIKMLLVDDVAEAYEKCYSSYYGFASIFGYRSSLSNNNPLEIPVFGLSPADNGSVEKWAANFFPSTSYRSAVDALVIWLRTVMRDLDKMTLEERELTLVLPLVEMGLVPPGSAPNSVQSQLSAGKPIVFELTASKLPVSQTSLERSRVVGIGVVASSNLDFALPLDFQSDIATSSPAVNQVSPTAWTASRTADRAAAERATQIKRARFRVCVGPPIVEEAGKLIYRRRIDLPDVKMDRSYTGENDVDIARDSLARNIPLLGVWEISFDRMPILWSTIPPTIAAHQPTTAQIISEVILYIRLAFTPLLQTSTPHV